MTRPSHYCLSDSSSGSQVRLSQPLKRSEHLHLKTIRTRTVILLVPVEPAVSLEAGQDQRCREGWSKCIIEERRQLLNEERDLSKKWDISFIYGDLKAGGLIAFHEQMIMFIFSSCTQNSWTDMFLFVTGCFNCSVSSQRSFHLIYLFLLSWQSGFGNYLNS